MEAIQEQGGWDALLSTVTHLQGVQVVARVMRELPRALRVPIFHQLVELLSTKFCSEEMVAMVFFVEAGAQKLRFLTSVCAVYEAALKDCSAHYRLCVCPLEVAQCIEALLQEKPTEFLDMELRQQAMSAIAAMRIEQRPPSCTQEAWTEKRMVLQASRPCWGTDEVCEMQVPLGSGEGSFALDTSPQQENPMSFIRACCTHRPQVCSCFTGAVVLRHKCTENQRFPVLGKLTGHLILCCTSSDEGTRDEAMKAVCQLFIFIASQRMWLWQKDPKKPQLRERWQTLFYEQISQENNASKIFKMFLKYLLYPEKVDVFLTAIESMTEPRLHSTELAAHMVDVLAAEAHFPPGQLAERRKSAGQDYLGQSLLYLQSPQESLRREAARFIDSGARAVALPVLSTLLRLLEGRKLSLAALELAGNLPALFEDESSTVRQLSIRLFLDTLSFVEGSEKKMVRKEVYRSLVPLCLHLHDEEESVAKLAERRKSAGQDYLGQSLLYLQSPQESLRREAARFIGEPQD
ncbi:UNVERIFIED_CONTAM: hypothetical protein H355_002603 [Colinus virginianus]|nr:hypothetical protein H355_002603 [Colinus virginianus]